MIVVADTSPLHYLILIEYVHVLPDLYGRVLVPPAVVTELDREQTPESVQKWISARPGWLEVVAPRQVLSSLRDVLGPGEREAIALAQELSADALLIDDREGRREAEKRKLAVLGTLRVLADASEHEAKKHLLVSTLLRSATVGSASTLRPMAKVATSARQWVGSSDCRNRWSRTRGSRDYSRVTPCWLPTTAEWGAREEATWNVTLRSITSR